MIEIDDPVFDGCVLLLAAVVKRARRDLAGVKASRTDRETAWLFLSDERVIDWLLAWTGHRQRRNYDD